MQMRPLKNAYIQTTVDMDRIEPFDQFRELVGLVAVKLVSRFDGSQDIPYGIRQAFVEVLLCLLVWSDAVLAIRQKQDFTAILDGVLRQFKRPLGVV